MSGGGVSNSIFLYSLLLFITGEAAVKTQQTLTFYELDLGLNHVVRDINKKFLIKALFL